MKCADITMAMQLGDQMAKDENKDYMLTHDGINYYVTPYGSQYNGHKLLEVFRSRFHYLRGKR